MERGRAIATAARSPWTVWVPGAVLHLAIGLVRLGSSDLLDDEAYSLAATHHLWETLTETHGTMAVYYLALTPWSWVSSSPIWLRLLSLLPMAGAVAVLARLVERQTTPATGRWAGVLAASAFLPVRFAFVARSYGMVALLVALSWLLLDRAVAGEDPRRTRCAYLVCVVLLPLTHGLAVLQVLVQAIAVVWSRPSRGPARWLLGCCAASLAVGGALYVLGGRSIGAPAEPLVVGQVRVFARRLLVPSLKALAPLVILAALGARQLLTRPGRTAPERLRQVSLVLWGVGAPVALLVLSLVRPSMVDRYSIAAPFALAGLIAIGATIAGPRWWRAVAPGAVLAILLVGQSELPRPSHPWTAAVDVVAGRAEPDDVILFAPSDQRLAFEAARGADDRWIPPLAAPSGSLGTFDRFGQPWTEAPDPAQAMLAPRIWLVTKRDPVSADRTDALLPESAIGDRFTVTGRWRVGEGVVVTLFTR